MTLSWIAAGKLMDGSVILSINQENPTITQDLTEKYAHWTLTLAFLTNKGLVMLWQISYDWQQKKISVYLT
jgi:HKD family nuclease